MSITLPTTPKKSNSHFLGAVTTAFIARSLGAVATLAMNLAITRALGVKDAGYFFIAFAVVAFFSPICRAGMDNAVMRFVSAGAAEEQWGTIQSIFRQSLFQVLIISGIVAGSLWSLSPWVCDHLFRKPELVAPLRAVAPALIGISLCFLIGSALQAIRSVIGVAFSQSFGVALLVGGAAPFVANAEMAGRVFCFASFFTAGVSFLWWTKKTKQAEGIFPRRLLWESALPMWIVTGATALQEWSGQFIAGALVSPEDFARLAVAQRVAAAISFMLVAVNLIAAPKFSALHRAGDIQELRRLAQSSVRLLLVAAGPCLVVTFLFAGKIMAAFGPGFLHGALLLRIFAVGQLVNAATGSVGYLLTMTGHERECRNVTLVVAPIAVTLTLVSTLYFGVNGAAVATAVALSAQNLAFLFMVKKKLGFFTIAFWQR